jgi:1-acyl-sn-glycerol-3-phosphate acyltransferase
VKQWTAKKLMGFFCWLLTFTVRIHIKFRVDPTKNIYLSKLIPKIFVIPHPSTLDPFYFYKQINHPRILMTEFVFGIPFIGWVVKHAGYIPVKLRGRETKGKSCYERAKQALLFGDSILIAPEGQLSDNSSFENAKTGAARLAMETGVLVVPIGMRYEGKIKEMAISDGTNTDISKFCWGGDYYVNVGQPFRLKKQDPKEATKFIMCRIRQLM